MNSVVIADRLGHLAHDAQERRDSLPSPGLCRDWLDRDIGMIGANAARWCVYALFWSFCFAFSLRAAALVLVLLLATAGACLLSRTASRVVAYAALHGVAHPLLLRAAARRRPASSAVPYRARLPSLETLFSMGPLAGPVT